jgi:hypothetical protein
MQILVRRGNQNIRRARVVKHSTDLLDTPKRDYALQSSDKCLRYGSEGEFELVEH